MWFALVCVLAVGCNDRAGSSSIPAGPDMREPWVLLPNGGFDPRQLTTCTDHRQQTTRKPLYMLFVLDGSGSMADDNKWTAVVQALDAIFDNFKTLADNAFAVGLTVFADEQDATITDDFAGPYDKIDVPLGFVDATHAAALRTRVDSTQPNLGTPTYEVLSGQYPLLEAYTPTAPIEQGGKATMVFLTDGVPDPDMPAGVNEQPWSLALAATQAQKSPPVQTFVVGIGNLAMPDPEKYDPIFLGHLAENGGVPKASCNPDETMDASKMCHFQITPGGKTAAELTQEFVSTINEIRIEALPCEYNIARTPNDGLDPASINVVFTPSVGGPVGILSGGTNGWTYDNPNDPHKLFLHGQSCQMVSSDLHGKIEIVIGCRTLQEIQ